MTVSNENQHDLVSLVKSKLDIVDLVSKYVDLKRSSRTLKGLCPFYQRTLLHLLFILKNRHLNVTVDLVLDFQVAIFLLS